MGSDQIDYQQLTRDALRDVVRKVLAQAAEEGLPGEHHFYLTFDTTHPGVEVSAQARNLYPQEMTVVLQHQFWDLAVDDEAFSVTLRFGGQKQRVLVPFEALTTFVDPAAEFGLNLERVEPEGDHDVVLEADDDPSADRSDEESVVSRSESGGDVVPIDRFRKK